jgi:hypothetical protein
MSAYWSRWSVLCIPSLSLTSAPLHLCTSAPLHLCTSPPLHLSTSAPLHLTSSSSPNMPFRLSHPPLSSLYPPSIPLPLPPPLSPPHPPTPPTPPTQLLLKSIDSLLLRLVSGTCTVTEAVQKHTPIMCTELFLRLVELTASPSSSDEKKQLQSLYASLMAELAYHHSSVHKGNNPSFVLNPLLLCY